MQLLRERPGGAGPGSERGRAGGNPSGALCRGLRPHGWGQKEDEAENARIAKQGHNNQRDFEDFKTEPKSEKPKEARTVVKGFGNSKGKQVSNGDFDFEAPKKTHTSQRKSGPKPAPSTPKNGGDFFDSDFGGVSKNSSKTKAKPVGKITNDDFNF